MTGARVVAIGASAGGVEALAELVAGLRAEFPAPLLVVLHVSPTGTSVLPEILSRVGPLRAINPKDGERLRAGVIYIAPRGVHMLVRAGHARLVAGPVEHGARPAIDPLFRSVARAYGPSAVGVVLSGMLDDGTAGLREIKREGGVAIAQEPDSAAFAQMPRSAIEHVAVDHVLPPAGIAQELDGIVRAPAPASAPAVGTHSDRAFEVNSSARAPGMRTDITCPTCGGVLWEDYVGGLLLYRCPARHAFTADTLLAVQDQGLEAAMSRPVRALRERGALLQRLAARAAQRGREESAVHFRAQAGRAEEQAVALERSISRERERRHEPEPSAAGDAGGERTSSAEQRASGDAGSAEQ